MATAAGPTATEFAPLAVESARLEFTWKYLIPPPPAMVATVLLTVESPVEREVIPLWAVERPVDRDLTPLLVVDRPVESEMTPL